VGFALADKRLAEGEACVDAGKWAEANAIAASVGKLYHDIAHDPKTVHLPRTKAEAARRRTLLADLSVHWENRRR
jgi:hypothetical protein